ncbi:MAG: dTDP-4-dehydrorhamnose reductase [Candidatus Dormibacteria bacterium]
MKFLVLGAGGQLGRELCQRLPALGHEAVALDRQGLDLTRAQAVETILARLAPDRVVNCAAYTRVDDAELHPEEAYAVNRDGAANVASACAGLQVPLCHISTDFVFTQDPPEPVRPWSEVDVPLPRGVYAESKRAGELECLSRHQDLFLVRTAWLFGGAGPNFPIAICRAAAQGRSLRVVDDQTGTPTWTGALAPALVRLLETESYGLYHLTASGSATWLEFARAVLERVGITAEVQPTSTSAWAARAPRPRYSVLENRRWLALGMAALEGWEQGLAAYVESEREGALAGLAPSAPAG